MYSVPCTAPAESKPREECTLHPVQLLQKEKGSSKARTKARSDIPGMFGLKAVTESTKGGGRG